MIDTPLLPRRMKLFLIGIAVMLVFGFPAIDSWHSHQAEFRRYPGWVQLRYWHGQNGRVSTRIVISWRNKFTERLEWPSFFQETLDYNQFK